MFLSSGKYRIYPQDYIHDWSIMDFRRYSAKTYIFMAYDARSLLIFIITCMMATFRYETSEYNCIQTFMQLQLNGKSNQNT